MQEEKHIVKEKIVRLYDADLAQLKSALKEVSKLPNTKVELYAKDKEFIVRLIIECGGVAAATTLCDSAYEMIENAQPLQCYGSGNGTLAHVVAGVLITNDTGLSAANIELGEALETEFATTRRGSEVYDNGERTYKRTNVQSKRIKAKDKTIEKYGENSLQAATDMAFAACKAGKTKFGAASTEADENGQIWTVVTYGSKVYARQLNAYAPTREMALAVLDLVRRIGRKENVSESTRSFKKGKIHPECPSKKGANIIVPSIIALIIAAALAFAIYYYYNIYNYVPNEITQPVGTLISQEAKK